MLARPMIGPDVAADVASKGGEAAQGRLGTGTKPALHAQSSVALGVSSGIAGQLTNAGYRDESLADAVVVIAALFDFGTICTAFGLIGWYYSTYARGTIFSHDGHCPWG